MTAKSVLRRAVAFFVAVGVTAVLGSIIQTQINLAAIVGLGASVPSALRVAVTAQDLAGFAPVMAGIAAVAFIPAFGAAWLAGRFIGLGRGVIYAAAGFAGLWTAFWAMGFFTPMPTLIAAVRGLGGQAAMATTGLVGGLVFAMIARGSTRRDEAGSANTG
jgi:hypothetical protein